MVTLNYILWGQSGWNWHAYVRSRASGSTVLNLRVLQPHCVLSTLFASSHPGFNLHLLHRSRIRCVGCLLLLQNQFLILQYVYRVNRDAGCGLDLSGSETSGRLLRTR